VFGEFLRIGWPANAFSFRIVPLPRNRLRYRS
jgi:hypothetical protein